MKVIFFKRKVLKRTGIGVLSAVALAVLLKIMGIY